jgi:transcription antitermination factor NusG
MQFQVMTRDLDFHQLEFSGPSTVPGPVVGQHNPPVGQDVQWIIEPSTTSFGVIAEGSPTDPQPLFQERERQDERVGEHVRILSGQYKTLRGIVKDVNPNIDVAIVELQVIGTMPMRVQCSFASLAMER